MELFLSIVLTLLMGWLTSYYAQQRGRNPTTWFFVGLIGGIFGLLLLFILPKVESTDQPATQTQQTTQEDETVEIKPIFAAKIPAELDRDWYYVDQERQQKGPVYLVDFQKLWRDKIVNADTFVWHEGMENWKRVADHATLYHHLTQSDELTPS